MKKIIITLLALASVLVVLSPSEAGAAGEPYVYGTQSGQTMTFVNNFDVKGSGYAVFASKVNVTCTAPDGTEGFWTNDHTTYTRVLAKYGTRYVWVYRYVYDGENIGLYIPAHSTVVITCK